jgi:hypothetical protein
VTRILSPVYPPPQIFTKMLTCSACFAKVEPASLWDQTVSHTLDPRVYRTYCTPECRTKSTIHYYWQPQYSPPKGKCGLKTQIAVLVMMIVMAWMIAMTVFSAYSKTKTVDGKERYPDLRILITIVAVGLILRVLGIRPSKKEV